MSEQESLSSVPGHEMIVKNLADISLVSELVWKSVFNCGQIRGRDSTKGPWGLLVRATDLSSTHSDLIVLSGFALLSQRGAEECILGRAWEKAG